MKNLIGIKIALLIVCLSLAFPVFSVNVNKASAGEISEALKGVGPAKAAAIIVYRKKHGPFKSLKDLVNVKGIGAATVDKNRENIQLK